MSRFVRQYRKHPVIRSIALDCVRHLPERAWSEEIRCLFERVRDDIRYVRDIRGVETLQSPVRTVQIGQGDCDDKAILLASLLESIGHPTRFVALKFQHMPIFSHVLTETRLGSGWVPLDAIMKEEMGWYPPEPAKRMVAHN